MDERVKNNLICWVGLPVATKTNKPFMLKVSELRTDEPFNCFIIHRNLESDCVFATCIPRMFDKLESVLKSLSSFEIFSSYGTNEIMKMLTEDELKILGQGFGYSLTSLGSFTPIPHTFNIVSSELMKPNIDSIFPRKFSCIIENAEVSFAKVYVRDNSGLVTIDVETKSHLRGKGIGCAVVSEATQWLQKQQLCCLLRGQY